MRRINVKVHLPESGTELPAALLDPSDIARHPRPILQGGRGRHQAQAIQIVRVLHFHHTGNDFLGRKSEPDAHPGK